MQNGGDVDEERCLREVSAGAHTAKVLSYTRTRYDPNYPPSPEAKCCDRGISYFGAQLAVLDETTWTELMGLRVGIRIVQKCPGPIVQSDLSGTGTYSAVLTKYWAGSGNLSECGAHCTRRPQLKSAARQTAQRSAIASTPS